MCSQRQADADLADREREGGVAGPGEEPRDEGGVEVLRVEGLGRLVEGADLLEDLLGEGTRKVLVEGTGPWPCRGRAHDGYQAARHPLEPVPARALGGAPGAPPGLGVPRGGRVSGALGGRLPRERKAKEEEKVRRMRREGCKQEGRDRAQPPVQHEALHNETLDVLQERQFKKDCAVVAGSQVAGTAPLLQALP